MAQQLENGQSMVVMQDRIGFPSMCTVQAPHSAIPHPNFVPVIPSTSRITHNSGMPGDTLKRAMSLMTNHRLRHLLVIGKLGRTSLASRTGKSGGT